ncbi:MAG: caspase family protein [Polaromonas sp.]|uniref:caspase family protein n=1 Tax=Polaromonas sp. TaxID=1869339 RepID=UPI0025F71B28|nr:caspase family protein [Polaromonas sp.]MBI2725472.1 caspase family protein [Polaromonas sp.]
MKRHHTLAVIALAIAGGALTLHVAGQPAIQFTTAVRDTELRSDKLGSAPVMGNLQAGARLNVLSVEGGWALVESSGARGWVRANALNLQSGSSAASGMDSGRQGSGNTALTLGTRGLSPRSNRHALIIGISKYGDPGISPLPGARIDRESATQMATAMQVPPDNISYLQDEQATGDNIRAALKSLENRVQEGDRVFIHYSGHGTRSYDAESGGCVEALLGYEGTYKALLTNREMASLLKPITNKTDKLFVMYDACHSGGIVSNASTVRTRGLGMAGSRMDPLGNGNDEGLLSPKVANISEECGRPVNVKTRNLLVESVTAGTLPQDIIHISASRDNEVSFDDSMKGGLATQFVRDCMLRDAVDIDKSGAISMEEIRQCAQAKINQRMQNDANFKAHNLMLSGNIGFVPAWFSQVQLAAGPLAQTVALPVAVPAAQVPPVVVAPAPVRPPPGTVPAAPPVVAMLPAAKPPAAPAPVAVAAPPPAVVAAPAPVVAALTGEQALRQMFEQRDAKRRVNVSLGKTQLKIAQDTLELSVQSAKAGYVYVALAGSDNKSVYMLFPNDLDQNNRIAAGETLKLPRDNWRVKAGGPAGTNNLLVFVADGPRDLGQLSASKAGPFVMSLNDAGGRAKLGALMTASATVASQACQTSASRKNNPLCSDAYGAAMVSVDEVK